MKESLFNDICAKKMGWVSCKIGASTGTGLDNTARFNAEAWVTSPVEMEGCIKYWKNDYNPYDDITQLVQVVEKIMQREGLHITIVDEETVLSAFRKFVTDNYGT